MSHNRIEKDFVTIQYRFDLQPYFLTPALAGLDIDYASGWFP